MDATALALSLDRSRGTDGVISLRHLQTELLRRGFEELARAVDDLARRLTTSKVEMDTPTLPWF
jgi:hypothetical protein